MKDLDTIIKNAAEKAVNNTPFYNRINSDRDMVKIPDRDDPKRKHGSGGYFKELGMDMLGMDQGAITALAKAYNNRRLPDTDPIWKDILVQFLSHCRDNYKDLGPNPVNKIKMLGKRYYEDLNRDDNYKTKEIRPENTIRRELSDYRMKYAGVKTSW